jgi:hypothetical protein
MYPNFLLYLAYHNHLRIFIRFVADDDALGTENHLRKFARPKPLVRSDHAIKVWVKTSLTSFS